jgi:hypothetical protein
MPAIAIVKLAETVASHKIDLACRMTGVDSVVVTAPVLAVEKLASMSLVVSAALYSATLRGCACGEPRSACWPWGSAEDVNGCSPYMQKSNRTVD